MRKVMVIVCLLFCLSGCVSTETRTLALGIYGYQLKQEIVINRFVDGDMFTEEEKSIAIKDAEALSRAMGVLVELLGAPR